LPNGIATGAFASTEEEFHIAGGSSDTLAALRAVRAVSKATLVRKRGAAGAVEFTGPIPNTLDESEIRASGGKRI
jgi:5-dehydro-2-deoxygluconokinase